MAKVNVNTRNRVESSNDCIDYVRSKTDEVILFCSLGKDSLVVLDMIAPKFKRVVCVFMYFVKDLEHINRFARYIQCKYTNIEYVEVPHWSLTYTMRGGMYCLSTEKNKLLTLKDVIAAVRSKYGIFYCFTGMKKADGMNRNLMLKTYEQSHYVSVGKDGKETGTCYPLADWNQKDVLSYMRQHNLPEPIRYSTSGKAAKASSGCGFNLDCFLYLEEKYPQDLVKIVDCFPLSYRILFEYHHKQGDYEEFRKKFLGWQAMYSTKVN